MSRSAGDMAHHRPRAWLHARRRLQGGSVHGSTADVNVYVAHNAALMINGSKAVHNFTF